MRKTSETSSTATLLDVIENDCRPVVDLMAALQAFRIIVDRRDEAEAAVTQAVAGMRQQRMSWEGIARVLGVSRQAAQQRYGA